VEPAITWVLSEGRWESYTTSNGLPNNHIRALVFDADGHLWVGTDISGGRFDGTEWEYVTMPPIGVNDIVFDDQGRAWLADGLGVEVYEGGTLTTYGYGEGLSSVQSKTILLESRGRVWVGFRTGQDGGGGSGGGIDVLERGQWKHYSVDDGLFGNNVYDLAEDTLGNIWAVGEGGISWFDGTKWKTMTLPDQSITQAINCITFDPSGRVWLGTTQLGVWIWDGETWTRYTADDGLASDTVWTIEFDAAGRVWLGTGEGLTVLDGKTWTVYTTDDGLVFKDVRVLAFAADGVWVGTWRGLSHLILETD
jgi:ligand-binding sensor domain-containing protein